MWFYIAERRGRKREVTFSSHEDVAFAQNLDGMIAFF